MSRSTNLNDAVSIVQEEHDSNGRVLNLIAQLCQSLREKNISYCHWKSNNALDRSASGDNDLDLLVSRTDVSRFLEILCRFGFKQAAGPKEKEVIGATHYYGYDELANKIVHVHVHTQIVVGHDVAKTLRLPIEQPYLESVSQDTIFNVPSPEFEYIVFIIRMVLKHCTWDAVLSGSSNLKTNEERELKYLQDQVDHNIVKSLLEQHFPNLDPELFNLCVSVLQPTHSKWERIKTGKKLHNSFQASNRQTFIQSVVTRLWRRSILAVRRRIYKEPSKHNLVNGGITIAVVGSDGAGKSTAVDEIYKWLSEDFNTAKFHLGKPGWSWNTTVIRIILKIGQIIRLYPPESSSLETFKLKSPIPHIFPTMLREVCRARDRYHKYLEAQRFAANGGIVVLDRLPVPQIQLMDGPLSKRLANLFSGESSSELNQSLYLNNPYIQKLAKKEQSYYDRIFTPEIVIALRISPEIAIQRRPGEDETEIRARAQEIWNIDWHHSSIFVIDASLPKDEVILKLKSLIWSRL